MSNTLLQSADGAPTLQEALLQLRQRLEHGYLSQAQAPGCVLPPCQPRTFYPLRLLQIQQLAYSDESLHERLVSVYDAISGLVQSCFLMVEGTETGITLSLGVRSQAPQAAVGLLRAGLEANFPGIFLRELDSAAVEQTMCRLEGSAAARQTVSAVTIIPSERKPGAETEALSVQGLEKLIESMMGKRYTALLLAVPYAKQAVEQRIAALQNISTLLSPYAELTVQAGSSQAIGRSDAVSRSVADSLVKNLSLGYSATQTQSTFQQQGRGKGWGISPLGLGINWSDQTGGGSGTSSATGSTTTQGRSTGRTATYGTTQTDTLTQTQTMGCSSRWKNKEVQELLQQLDRQLQRLYSGGGSFWDCCAYFIAQDPADSVMAARSFQSLVSGQNTRSHSLCTVWQTLPGQEQSSNLRNLLACLRYAEAPRFRLADGSICCTDSLLPVTELPRVMSLPRRSVPGLTVVQMAGFGRSIHYAPNRLPTPAHRQALLGHIVHMGRVTSLPVQLDLDSLCAHGLVVGASGSGKTTVTCELLRHLVEQGIGFTVIEPAKGEYKKLFGLLPGLRVFTVDRSYRMLRFNPFAFPPEVQVLDHIDRLIDSFSVCWPLYAAQPALLRQCVCRAYISRGWDLTNSVFRPTVKDPFPTFKDLLTELPYVIEENRLQGEVRGNYEGTLHSRLSMLVSGVFGQVFCSGQNVSDAELFEGYTILDLSTVGSSETRSLLMALLINRLYEYRITRPDNGHGLHHLTLLEEAHNVLRAAPAAAEEGSGTTAKAVESLAKCIAELRFTHEGFLIVDQSPGCLDPVALKNTSSKIALRLTYADDQEAAARSMGLTKEQSAQLAQLPNGTAVILQEGWTEPVLFQGEKRPRPWEEKGQSHTIPYRKLCQLRAFLLRGVLEQYSTQRFDAASLQELLHHRVRGLDRYQTENFQALFDYYQSRFLRVQRYFADPVYALPFYGELMEALLSCEGLLSLCPLPRPAKTMRVPYSRDAAYRSACEGWRQQARETLELYAGELTLPERDTVLRCLLLYHGQTDPIGLLVSSVLFSAAQKSKNEKGD